MVLLVLGVSQLIQWAKYVTPKGNGYEGLKTRVEKLEGKLEKVDLVTLKELLQDLNRKFEADQKDQKEFRHKTNANFMDLVSRDFEIERLLLKIGSQKHEN